MLAYVKWNSNTLSVSYTLLDELISLADPHGLGLIRTHGHTYWWNDRGWKMDAATVECRDEEALARFLEASGEMPDPSLVAEIGPGPGYSV